MAAGLADVAIAYAPTLLVALLTLVIGWLLTKTIVGMIRRAMKRAKLDDTLTGFVCNMSYMALMTLVVLSFIGKPSYVRYPTPHATGHDDRLVQTTDFQCWLKQLQVLY